MPNILGWMLVIVLVLINIVVWIWAFHARSDLKQCENTESNLCPVYHCTNTIKACANGAELDGKSGSAFRKDKGGNTQCQKYSLPTTVTNTPPASRVNWPT